VASATNTQVVITNLPQTLEMVILFRAAWLSHCRLRSISEVMAASWHLHRLMCIFRWSAIVVWEDEYSVRWSYVRPISLLVRFAAAAQPVGHQYIGKPRAQATSHKPPRKRNSGRSSVAPIYNCRTPLPGRTSRRRQLDTSILPCTALISPASHLRLPLIFVLLLGQSLFRSPLSVILSFC
jgi:hypothetical protein